jgi:hypothetical protein
MLLVVPVAGGRLALMVTVAQRRRVGLLRLVLLFPEAHGAAQRAIGGGDDVFRVHTYSVQGSDTSLESLESS